MGRASWSAVGSDILSVDVDVRKVGGVAPDLRIGANKAGTETRAESGFRTVLERMLFGSAVCMLSVHFEHGKEEMKRTV